MDRSFTSVIRWLFLPEDGPGNRLLPRWLFLRGLGLIYFSAFYPLLFQIKGLIGPDGILPAHDYLEALAKMGLKRFWYAPTLFWFGSGSHMLMAVCWVGLAAAILLLLNVWPRATLAMCFICFLSFVSAAQDFSGYQSDGMLLEAGFISLFFAPAGVRPGLGRHSLPIRASLFLLQWEWFRIYFESGVVKLASGEPQWRNFTAMDEYYQNGPLPTWIGWYVQHLPHWFHAFTTGATLALELFLVWSLFLPRRWRIACFFIVTLWQLPVTLTANYTFLNYLVLLLGVLLLDDEFLQRCLPKHLLPGKAAAGDMPPNLRSVSPDTAQAALDPKSDSAESISPGGEGALSQNNVLARPLATSIGNRSREAQSEADPADGAPEKFGSPIQVVKLALTSVILGWIFYATTVQLLWILLPWLPLPRSPVVALDPCRIANRYGLFAVMTRGRYEIEFQGSNDGETWTAYKFRYKPQDLSVAPRIYAPYQPRFEWNLWFASLDTWRDNMFVVSTQERLLANNHDVLALFTGNPFGDAPPKQLRAVIWEYWFASLEEKRATGRWWRRKFLGLYAPTLTYLPDGRLGVLEWPPQVMPRP